MSDKLTHFDDQGAAHMVDVSDKDITARIATAKGRIIMEPTTLAMIANGTAKKGDVLGIARLAGIMAAKKTPDLIPLCHPLPITKVSVDLDVNEANNCIDIEATVKTTGQTGVEMEALTGANITCLTIYDMCKSISQKMVIKEVKLIENTGGKSDIHNF